MCNGCEVAMPHVLHSRLEFTRQSLVHKGLSQTARQLRYIFATCCVQLAYVESY
jgi:hypothetical protein